MKIEFEVNKDHYSGADKIRRELARAKVMLEKETERIRAREGKEVHAEQMHYWDGRVNGLKMALKLLNEYW
jgi:hypothetical protein